MSVSEFGPQLCPHHTLALTVAFRLGPRPALPQWSPALCPPSPSRSAAAVCSSAAESKVWLALAGGLRVHFSLYRTAAGVFARLSQLRQTPLPRPGVQREPVSPSRGSCPARLLRLLNCCQKATEQPVTLRTSIRNRATLAEGLDLIWGNYLAVHLRFGRG